MQTNLLTNQTFNANHNNSANDAFYAQPKRCQVAPQEQQFLFISHLEYTEI